MSSIKTMSLDLDSETKTLYACKFSVRNSPWVTRINIHLIGHNGRNVTITAKNETSSPHANNLNDNTSSQKFRQKLSVFGKETSGFTNY